MVLYLVWIWAEHHFDKLNYVMKTIYFPLEMNAYLMGLFTFFSIEKPSLSFCHFVWPNNFNFRKVIRGRDSLLQCLTFAKMSFTMLHFTYANEKEHFANIFPRKYHLADAFHSIKRKKEKSLRWTKKRHHCALYASCGPFERKLKVCA